MTGTSTQVVVLCVGISRYAKPPAAEAKLGRTRFDDLSAVDNDLARLARLFDSEPYRNAGFAVWPWLTGTTGQITDQLTKAAAKLAGEPGRTVLLVWSGHGETPGNELRLATKESYRPMRPGEGFSPSELVNKLAGCGAKWFCLILDVCQAGAASGDVAATAADRFKSQPPTAGVFPGMAALFSTQPYEPAEDGLFAEVLERVLREGPSAAARAEIATVGWGGFSTQNRFLTSGELDNVLQVEFDLLGKRRSSVQNPVGVRMGRDFGLFPNPLFEIDAPPVSVELVRRRWLRQQDLDTHFLPKARGLEPGEQGWFFSGRSAVTRQIVDWLDGRGDAGSHHLYVLTGQGGSGKSAIIGRIVALSDTGFRHAAANVGWDEAGDSVRGTVPGIGRIDAALHLRNLTAESTALAISELAGISPPDPALGLSAFVFNAPNQLADSPHPVTVMLDALDEAGEPARIAELLIRPLAAKGWRILVGTRAAAAHRGASDLLDRLGPAYRRNLDSEDSTTADIAEYVQRRLAGTPHSPYAAAPTDASAIASTVAARARGVFLYARIAASRLLRRPRIDLAKLEGELALHVDDALAQDLASIDESFRRTFNRTDSGATSLLEALAWAEGVGLPLRDSLWPIVATAIARRDAPYLDMHVQWVLREAGRYVLEAGDGEQAVYRLYHESLNEHFRSGRDGQAINSRIASALQQHVDQPGGWDVANPYVVRYLPVHLSSDPERLERLCTDPRFLRRALDLLRVDGLADLLAAAQRACGRFAVQALAKSVRRARVALSRDPEQLAAQLHARLAGETDLALKALSQALPLAAPAVWLRSVTSTLGWRADLETMQTFNAKVRALALGSVEGSGVIAVGAGTNVSIWSPGRGDIGTWQISNAERRVTGLAMGIVGDRHVVAVAAGYDGILEVRDLRTGARIGDTMPGTLEPLAVGRLSNRDVLATTEAGNITVRPLDGQGPMEEREYPAGRVGRCGTALVAISEDRGTYEVVDLDSGKPLGPSLDDPPHGLVTVGAWRGRPILCFALESGHVQVRDLNSGECIGEPVAFDFRLRTLVVGELEGDLIVAAGNDSDSDSGYVAIRQPLASRTASPSFAVLVHVDWVLGVGRGNRRLLLFLDGMRAFDPVASEIVTTPAEVEVLSGVQSAPAMPAHAGVPRVRSGSLTLRRNAPGQWPILCHTWAIIDGRNVQARGSFEGVVWILDAERKKIVHGPYASVPDTLTLRSHKIKTARGLGEVTDVALAVWKGRGVMARAHEGRVTVFDLETEQTLGSPDTGRSEIAVVALGAIDDRTLLVTGSEGGAVTLWDGSTFRRLATMTLDARVARVWIGGASLVVRTADQRFHVFEIVMQ